MSGTAIIRPAAPADAGAIAAIYAPHVATSAVSFETEAPSAEEMGRRLATNQATHPWLVCERDGALLGYVYGSSHRTRVAYQWSAEVTAYVEASARRTGVARALYTSLFALMRLHGFYKAYAGITLPNVGSVGLHEAMGFGLVGIYRDVGYKLGAWHDVGWWGLDLQEKAEAPAPPRDSAAVRRDPGWQEALDAGLPLLRF